jgi:hypothetical protein
MSARSKRQPHRPGIDPRPLTPPAGDAERRSLYVAKHRHVPDEVDNPYAPGEKIKIERPGYDILDALFRSSDRRKRHGAAGTQQATLISQRQYEAGRRYQGLREVARGRNQLQSVDTAKPRVDISFRPRDGIDHDKLKAEAQLERLERYLGKRDSELADRVLDRGMTLPASMLARGGIKWPHDSGGAVKDVKEVLAVSNFGALNPIELEKQPKPMRPWMANIHEKSAWDHEMNAVKEAAAEVIGGIKAENAKALEYIKAEEDGAPSGSYAEIGAPDDLKIDSEDNGYSNIWEAVQAEARHNPACIDSGRDDLKGGQGFSIPSQAIHSYSATEYLKMKLGLGQRAIDAEGKRFRDCLSELADFFENDREGSNY